MIDRVKEIGIRRAIGAQKKDILIQFLSEAVLLSFLGGVMGLLLAYGVTVFLSFFIPAKISFVAILVAIFVSSVIGIIFGVFPAKRAAELSPIEAIRYE